jgi:hypothetical protein
MFAALLGLVLMQFAGGTLTVSAAASTFAPRVVWRESSTVSADFTCEGHAQQAILGNTATEIVVAVFAHGLDQAPELLRYSTEMRDPAKVRMTVEPLTYRSKDAPDLRKFHLPPTCRGLRVDDGRIPPAHVYWNPETKQFADWVPSF